MSNRPTRLFIVALTLGLITVATTFWLMNRAASLPQQPLRLVIHNTADLPLIDKFADEAKLPILRQLLLPAGDFEVRVWVGFGLNGEDGLILRRSNGQWSATHLHGMAKNPPFPKSQKSLAAPKSGWDKAWQKLVGGGILILPNAHSISCSGLALDGVGFLVETNKDNIYRTYMYDNPELSGCRQAKQMILIGKIIAEEFGLEWFDIGDWCGDKNSPLYPCHH